MSWEEQLLASLPVYEGRDPNLHESNYCMICYKANGDPAEQEDGAKAASSSVIQLKVCSRCRCAYFCSVKCQEAAWKSGHKTACNAIKKAETKLEREASKLRSCTEYGFSFGNPPTNLFETDKGRFWGILETRDYMRARIKVANLIYEEFAYELETVELWEKVLMHYQEMLRLCSSDNMGLRYRFPFLLLYLNRDDDAYAFCRYWTNSDEDGSYEARERIHKNSKEGEWIYPREEGCRYNDFFAECPSADNEYASLPMLVAVCIVKLRLVAAFDEKKKRRVTQDESPEHVQTIESNRRQIHALMNRIHANNPTMLPSILNPMPLKSQGLSPYQSPGHPSEAASVLNDCNRAFVRVPGAADILLARFGPNPTYNSNMDL